MHLLGDDLVRMRGFDAGSEQFECFTNWVGVCTFTAFLCIYINCTLSLVLAVNDSCFPRSLEVH